MKNKTPSTYTVTVTEFKNKRFGYKDIRRIIVLVALGGIVLGIIIGKFLI